jgi:hypothetical protein
MLKRSCGNYVRKRFEEVGYKKEQIKKKTIIEREEEKERVSSGPARRGALGTWSRSVHANDSIRGTRN